MSIGLKIYKRLSGVLLLFFMFTVTFHQGYSKELVSNEIIPLKMKNEIKVVYQINRDNWRNGVGSGLLYIKKLLGTYNLMSIDVSKREVKAVLHGKAGYWLLNDKAYNEFNGVNTGNPNLNLVKELAKNGVSVELCSQTMKHFGWENKDLIPEVKIVAGAYARIIDLQLQGYAYIRF